MKNCGNIVRRLFYQPDSQPAQQNTQNKTEQRIHYSCYGHFITKHYIVFQCECGECGKRSAKARGHYQPVGGAQLVALSQPEEQPYQEAAQYIYQEGAIREGHGQVLLRKQFYPIAGHTTKKTTNTNKK